MEKMHKQANGKTNCQNFLIQFVCNRSIKMKCEVCEYEISEKNTICDTCGLDSEQSNFTDPGKLQTYYKAIGSDHWSKRVFLIRKVYENFLEKNRKGP